MSLQHQRGFVLPSLGLTTWLWIGGVLLVATNLFTAIKVADYVQDQNDLQNLNAKVAVIEREKEIQVLDSKTLAEALDKQAKRFKAELALERTLNDIISWREAATEPWCELDANELRVWNTQNDGHFTDDTSEIIRSREELSREAPAR